MKTPLLEQLYKKATPTQMFFFEYCKIFRKELFIEHLWTFKLFSISPFSSSHLKCSIKKAVVKVLQYSYEKTMLESLFNKVWG